MDRRMDIQQAGAGDTRLNEMRIEEKRRRRGDGAVRLILVGVFLVGVAAGIYAFWPDRQPAVQAEAPKTAQPAPAQPTGPRFPLKNAETKDEPPLPALNDSSKAVFSALQGIAGQQPLVDFLQPEELVRRIVVTVDNLPRKHLASRLNPIKPVTGMLATTGKETTLVMTPANAARYATVVRGVEAIDTARLVATYRRYYPLFQQAYAELGYGDAYFNDRVVEVIDHLLETPEVRGPIPLVVKHVLPEFADESLESRSAGQKMLIRAGPENAARIKVKLREIREAVLAVSR